MSINEPYPDTLHHAHKKMQYLLYSFLVVDQISYENLIMTAFFFFFYRRNLNSLISAEEEVENVVNHVP